MASEKIPEVLPVIIKDMWAGEADSHGQAAMVAGDFAAQLFSYLFYDGRSVTAVRVAALDKLGDFIQMDVAPTLRTKIQWVFSRREVPAHGDDTRWAFVLDR